MLLLLLLHRAARPLGVPLGAPNLGAPTQLPRRRSSAIPPNAHARH
jgi:hypothetical protein